MTSLSELLGGLRGRIEAIATDLDAFLELLISNVTTVGRGERPAF